MKININTATAEQLTELNGIGEVKANAIIEYRNNFGNFISLEEIMNVKGIGEKTFEKIKAENDFDSTIAVVAHGTFNSYLVLAALDFPLKDNFNFSHVNTGVSLVQTIKENGVIKTKLKFLNDYSHLDELPQL